LLQEALTSETNEKLGEEAQWGFLLTWLTFSEVVSEVGGYPSGDALDPQNPTSLARMAHRLVLARRQRDTVPRSEDADNELLKPLGLTSPKADLVRKWVREEISFTKKPARRRASSAQGSSG
jgi:hypothetical protein